MLRVVVCFVVCSVRVTEVVVVVVGPYLFFSKEVA